VCGSRFRGGGGGGGGAKNGADIRIVIDVMTALQHETCYDEFVLASSDADFTPLLQVLRAHDRRTAIIATGSTAVAYEALADQYLDEQDLFDLMVPAQESETDVVEEAASLLEAHSVAGDAAPGGLVERRGGMAGVLRGGAQ